ncbi:BnaC08g47070D [Brassica napus]|uniref:BnaC08g47070D protein n=2 Tax=Brassica TaxID=3705 RepID=A0A078IRC6_BRANA|nr:BnaC08g47070D [Brassica napus]
MTLFICNDADEDPANRNRVPPLSTPRPPLRRRRRKIAQNHHRHTLYSQIRTQIPEANILKLFELKAKAFELWENQVVGAQIFSDINHLFEFVLLLNLGLRSEKYMGDSVPLTLTLPELKYPIGSEPKEKKVSINQHSTSMYISIVESILTADEIERVRGFLGPLKKTKVDASDERVCLVMLLLVESILLPKNNKGTFPLEYVNKAKDMMYPWGRDAYLVLLRSIQKAVANLLEDTSKFELQGYPLVFHLWILESIPLLRDKFSNWAPTVDVPGPIYLCEKYTELENPSLERVLQIEAHKKVSFYSDLLKVTCILPPIPHDPEDDVSMEDEHSDELESVKDISKKGYKFKADDWKNRLAKLLLRLRRTQKIPN